MSKPKTELEKLLSNIQRGLKEFSIQELNIGIITFLNKKSDKSMEINYVLQMVADEYNFSKKALQSKTARGVQQEAKQITYCLLHYNLGFSTRQIARNVFFNNHNSVAIGVRKLKNADHNHKVDKNFIEKYEKLKSRLIFNFSNLNKQIQNEDI